MAKNIFDELEGLYSEIDQALLAKELEARQRHRTKQETAYQRKRERNDQAYFLYMFSRLEDRVKDQSVALIEHKYRTLTNWAQKRVWDVLNKRQRRDKLDFMEHVRLLVQAGHTHYNLIEAYYRQRNTIAHGGAVIVDMPTVIQNMKELYKAVKKT